MRFDDRLRTVLNTPAVDTHARAVRWRQLVDLLARAGSLEGSDLAAQALSVVRSETPFIAEELRAAAARAVAALPLPVELISLFAGDTLKVSAPVLAAAQLGPDQWAVVKHSANKAALDFIETLHPQSAPPKTRPSESGADHQSLPLTPSIKEVIDRIEALRSAREPSPLPPALPSQRATRSSATAMVRRPPPADKGLFQWECGPSGEVEWVEGAPRAALIGRTLVESERDSESGSGEIARAFALRAPFSKAVVTLPEGTALGGEWELSGMPAFDHASGRFAGYRGVAQRARPSGRSAEPTAAPHPDTLRELVHEIKTPLNAIMGFAEIIHGQMFGPAGSTYRSRAGEIVAQSQLLLAAIDDLDLAAKLQAGTLEGQGETDLAAVLEHVIPPLEQKAEKVGVPLRLLVEPHLPPCATSPAVVDRLLQRFIGSLIDCSESGEALTLTASHWNARCTVAVDRPFALEGISEQDLLDPSFAVPRQRHSRLSLGFSLRLVRGIAQLAGGDLAVTRSKLTLLLGPGGLRPPASDRYRRSAGQGL